MHIPTPVEECKDDKEVLAGMMLGRIEAAVLFISWCDHSAEQGHSAVTAGVAPRLFSQQAATEKKNFLQTLFSMALLPLPGPHPSPKDLVRMMFSRCN